MAEHILDGIRIVDLSSGLAGPVATQILAEAGADVVKVERPRGDPLRQLHPAAFATWNRSKRSVVLDLADGGDRGSLDGLLASSDVVVHDLRPSGAARLGLDDAGLGERFRRLVVCGVTGYPPNHADAERPGYDLLVRARGGLMDLQAGWGPGPFVWRMPVPSWFAALLAATVSSPGSSTESTPGWAAPLTPACCRGCGSGRTCPGCVPRGHQPASRAARHRHCGSRRSLCTSAPTIVGSRSSTLPIAST